MKKRFLLILYPVACSATADAGEFAAQIVLQQFGWLPHHCRDPKLSLHRQRISTNFSHSKKAIL